MRSGWEELIIATLIRRLIPARCRSPLIRTAIAAALFGPLMVPAPATAEDPRDPVILVEGVPIESGLRTLLLQETLRAYHSGRDWFGADVRGTITVSWAADPAALAQRIGSDPGPVAGVALAHRNLIVLNAQALASRPDRIVSVLHHEVDHLVFAAATSSAEVDAPRWLNEGIAMWRSGEWDLGLSYRSDHATLLRDASAAGSLLKFEDLDGAFPTGPFFHVAYAQSLSFVEWLLRRDGEDGLRRFIARLNEDADPEPAFEAAFGISLAAAEREWRTEIGGGWLAWLPSGQALIHFAWGGLGLLVVLRFIVVRWKFRRSMREEEEPFQLEIGEVPGPGDTDR